MSFAAWQMKILRRIARRIIADRQEAIIARDVPGAALIGIGFSHTFFVPVSHQKRVARVVDRMHGVAFHRRFASTFDSYGAAGERLARYHDEAASDIRFGRASGSRSLHDAR